MLERRRTILLAAGLLLLACGKTVDTFGPGSNVGGSGGDAGCPEGLTDCDGECLDVQRDPDHCGRCDHPCGSGDVCSAGVCDDECGPGEIGCSGSCVNPATHPDHCGGCDIDCRDDQICASYACLCPHPMSECDGACVDLDSDPNHCGHCDIGCDDSESCEHGECEGSGGCGGGLTNCGGDCVNLLYDDDHCGGCYQPCDPLTEQCQSGVCQCTQPVCGMFCDVIDLGSAVPQAIDGNTFGADDAHAPSCWPNVAPEQAYRFTAPAAGNYMVSGAGTPSGHIISLLTDTCIEVACDHGQAGGDYASLSVPFSAGQTGYIVVEGELQSIDYTLNIHQAPTVVCPEIPLGSVVPNMVPGTTTNAVDSQQVGCLPGSEGDATFGFTAPVTDEYVFMVHPMSMAEPGLEIRGGGCNGPPLGCDVGMGPGASATVVLSLQANQTVVLVVDALGPGDFDLEIDFAPPCPSGDLGSLSPQTLFGDTTGQPDVYTSMGCGEPSGPEVSYWFTPPADGNYTFDTIGTMFDTVVYVRDLDCNGPELGCDDESGGNSTSLLTLSLLQNQPVVVFVDSFDELMFGPYVLNISGP